MTPNTTNYYSSGYNFWSFTQPTTAAKCRLGPTEVYDGAQADILRIRHATLQKMFGENDYATVH